MSIIIPISIPIKRLKQSITSASSSFKVNNIKSWKKDSNGVFIDLAASDFGTRAFGAFRNDTGTILEIFEYDTATIASASITILKRGLDFSGNPNTEVTAYKFDWQNGTSVLFGTDIPQLLSIMRLIPAVIALTDAVTIATDASLGNVFTVVLAGNRTLGAPTNATNGQTIVYRIRQDATGSRTLAYNAIFRFGATVSSPTLSTTAAKTDYLTFRYNSTDTLWDCVNVVLGY